MYSEQLKNEYIRLSAEQDGLFFARYFFKDRFASSMLINGHHRVISEALQRVVDGEIKRLIISLPPRYTKTELAVINFIPWCLANNPKARFIHLSYSDELALENSKTAKDIIQSDKYQELWQLKLQDDSKSKKKWWTEQKGGVYATSAKGQVTGFGAGLMEPGFTGAIIIDDPIKPDDHDKEERKRVNERYNSTIASRKAHEDVPIIVIGQRVAKNDLSGYLLRGGSGEVWHHLNLPVKIDNQRSYNKEYTHGLEIEHGLSDGWLWEQKHSDANEVALKSHKRTWYSQYMQAPEDYILDGGLWSEKTLNKHRVDKKPDSTYTVVAIDPSGDDGSEESKSDQIGIVTASRGIDGHYYVEYDDSMNGSPYEWGSQSVSAYSINKANVLVYEKNFGGAMVKQTIRSVPGGQSVYLQGVTATKGKMLRAEPIAALYEQGLVHHVGFFPELEEELTEFDGRGKSPNRLDALVWALTYMELNGDGEQSAPTISL